MSLPPTFNIATTQQPDGKQGRVSACVRLWLAEEECTVK